MDPPPPIGVRMETSQGAVTGSSIAAIAGSEREPAGSIALDQWRGLALVLVLISHGFYFTDRVNGLGRVGVNLFFFISGILVFRSLSRIARGDGLGNGRAVLVAAAAAIVSGVARLRSGDAAAGVAVAAPAQLAAGLGLWSPTSKRCRWH